MKTFRENQFDLFLDSLRKLEMENLIFGFDIQKQDFNKPFIDNTNEYILLAIRNKGLIKSYKFVLKIIMNKEFKERCQKVTPKNVHTSFINNMLGLNMYFIAFSGYYIWSIKSKYSNLI